MNKQITKISVRTYRDNGQVAAYIEWSDGSTTCGPEHSAHIQALLVRGQRDGLPLIRETW